MTAEEGAAEAKTTKKKRSGKKKKAGKKKAGKKSRKRRSSKKKDDMGAMEMGEMQSFLETSLAFLGEDWKQRGQKRKFSQVCHSDPPHIFSLQFQSKFKKPKNLDFRIHRLSQSVAYEVKEEKRKTQDEDCTGKYPPA